MTRPRRSGPARVWERWITEGSDEQEAPSREEIVVGLLQVDVLVAQGRTIGAAARTIGVTRTTRRRLRNVFGGLEFDRAERRKELEAENHRPREAAANLTLGKVILTEAGGRHARPF